MLNNPQKTWGLLVSLICHGYASIIYIMLRNLPSCFNHYLFQALVRMTTLQQVRSQWGDDSSVPQALGNRVEGTSLVCWGCPHPQQGVDAKTATLEEEICRGKEAEKEKTNLTTKLTALREHMVKAKADIVAEYLVSQPFFNACDIYYGDGFDHCLKKVGADFPDLDLSQITIEEIALLVKRPVTPSTLLSKEQRMPTLRQSSNPYPTVWRLSPSSCLLSHLQRWPISCEWPVSCRPVCFSGSPNLTLFSFELVLN